MPQKTQFDDLRAVVGKQAVDGGAVGPLLQVQAVGGGVAGGVGRVVRLAVAARLGGGAGLRPGAEGRRAAVGRRGRRAAGREGEIPLRLRSLRRGSGNGRCMATSMVIDDR